MIRISVEVKSVQDAVNVLHKLGVDNIALNATPAIVEVAKEVPVDPLQKKGRYTRKPKGEAAPASPVPAPAPMPIPPMPPAPAVTVDDAQATLTHVFEAKGEKGYDVAVALLARFGVNKVKELKPEQLPEFMDRAKEVLAGTYDPLEGKK